MLKIISGKYKNLSLVQPPEGITRPMSQKVRAAVFNTIGDRIIDASVLDLFSGTGAMAIESISRGCSDVVLVENNQKALTAIRQNIQNIDLVEKITVVDQDADKFIGDCAESFDIIMLDPPYDRFKIDIVNRAANLLQYGGIIVASHASRTEINGLNKDLQIVSSKKYGDTQIEYISHLS